MLSQLTIPKKTPIASIDETTAPFDYEQLYTIGLQHIERLARRIWNDYNVHDPGITTLELLSFAITDLSYRASFPIKDLLASETNNAAEMSEQFFTARQILPNRALTAYDYRKLIIDVDGVLNAWIRPSQYTVFADTVHGALLSSPPAGAPGIVEVDVRGLYDVVLEFMDTVPAVDPTVVIPNVRKKLMANRNLCEDFVNITAVPTELFVLCAELELAPTADLIEVHAQILFQVEEYLTPPVRQYTLSQMLEMQHADGSLYTAEEIFDGPALRHGFIPDEELAASELRTDVRLSDIISIIMDVEGVLAVRDIKFNPAGASESLPSKWVIPVTAGHQAVLDRENWRIVSYKRTMPFAPDKAEVVARWLELAAPLNTKVVNTDDFDIPLGRYRDLSEYYSFQNHFPALYGVGDAGLPSGADERVQALSYQLKGYLLFFDQIMANYFGQLAHIRDLFSTDASMRRTYFYQLVDSFQQYDQIYNVAPGSVVSTLESSVWSPVAPPDRRNRFLDHLISRFAEQFTDFVHIMADQFGWTPDDMIPYKCTLLANYPALSGARSIGSNYVPTGPSDVWDSTNISGLEARLAALLGITDSRRRNLAGTPDQEGMYLIENVLLRSREAGVPYLSICPDPNCTECLDEDPYSYRIHIVLPAFGPRFGDIEFRRWAESMIRNEVPAHILPKICWISRDDMLVFQDVYHQAQALSLGGTTSAERIAKLTALFNELYTVRNIYPVEHLFECDDPESDPRFILGRSALGTQEP